MHYWAGAQEEENVNAQKCQRDMQQTWTATTAATATMAANMQLVDGKAGGSGRGACGPYGTWP